MLKRRDDEDPIGGTAQRSLKELSKENTSTETGP